MVLMIDPNLSTSYTQSPKPRQRRQTAGDFTRSGNFHPPASRIHALINFAQPAGLTMETRWKRRVPP
jgi:hypothetical protein